MKYRLLVLLMIITAPYTTAQISRDSLSYMLDTLLTNEFFESTQIAVNIYDLTEGEYIYQKNVKMLMVPASNMKLLTTAAALLYLGPDYKFKTRMYLDGKIVDGEMNGNLYIKGGLDPDFSLDDLRDMVGWLLEKGVKEINGNIYADVSMMDDLFWGEGWMWDDDPSIDVPYLTPLNINDNSVSVIINSGRKGRKVEVELEPESDYFVIENNATTTSRWGNDLTVERDYKNRTNKIFIEGEMSSRSGERRKEQNVFDPARYFLTLFKETVVDTGIVFEGELDVYPVPYRADLIYTFERPFNEVLVNLNKESDNLSAEMTLRALGIEHSGVPAVAENGLALIDSLTGRVGLCPCDYEFSDGSGLSRYNLVTAELIMEILKYMYYEHPELYVIWKNSFPLAGEDGTLEKRMIETDAEGNVWAKTGTLSGVSNLSGYAETEDDHVIAFSILVQKYVNSSRRAREYQDIISQIIAGSVK